MNQKEQYLIRYYMHGDKTRFYELVKEVSEEVPTLGHNIRHFERNYPSATIQKIVKL